MKKMDALRKKLLAQDLPNNKSHIEDKIPNLFLRHVFLTTTLFCLS